MNKFRNSIFISLLVFNFGILQACAWPLLRGNAQKQYFYDTETTIMYEDYTNNELKHDTYWTKNIFQGNKYKPSFMLSGKELIKLVTAKKKTEIKYASAPRIYNISLKNSSIVNVSLNSPGIYTINSDTTINNAEDEKYLAMYRVAKGSLADSEQKIDVAVSLKESGIVKNYIRAIDLLNEVTAKDPTNSYAFCLKGQLFYLKNDNENAMKCYLKALDIDPDNKDCYYGIAKIIEPINKSLADKYYNSAK